MENGMAFHLYRDAQGYWRWRLVAANGRRIADSGEGYNNRQDCRAGIDLVKGSSSAPVYEQ
jgi:uncharacterized protein YegP (UPF0339 family)